MVVGRKDIFKMLGIVIISICAVFVCTLFLNFNIDIKDIEGLLVTVEERAMYDALVMIGKVIGALAGGCLLLTSVVVLCFYIKNYIDTHRKELGILKAIGYSEAKIARGFWVFGWNVFLGAVIGYGGAHLLMPRFYEIQGKDHLLPEVIVRFHPTLFAFLVVLPTILFGVVSVLYGYRKLKAPVMDLLRGKSVHKVKVIARDTNLSFLDELRKNTVRQRKSLVFFIAFASFCFAAMVQMSLQMEQLASVMMKLIMLMIGIILAFATLLLAITTVVKSNSKNFAMMKVFGYSAKECAKAVLAGYRPMACIGFFIGTIYQYVLMQLVTKLVFADIDNIPDLDFDVRGFFLTLISFLIFYELLMTWYTRKIGKISIKEIMLDAE